MSEPSSQQNIFKRLRPYYSHLKPVKWHFVGGILASFLYAAASGFGLPLMTKTVFPIIFREEKEIQELPEWFREFIFSVFGENPETGVLIASIIALPLMMLLRSVGHFLSGYWMGYTGVKVSESIRTEVFSHIQTMPLSFFHKYRSGDLLSRLMGDTEAVKRAVVDLSMDIFKQPMTLIAALSFLISSAIKQESFMFALVAIVTAPLLVLPIKAIGQKLAKRSKQLTEAGAELTSFTNEAIQSPLEIRAYNLQQNRLELFSAKIQRILLLSLKQVKYNLFATPLIEFVAAASLSFALYVGASKGMQMADFVALAFALYMAYDPVKKLGRIHGKLKALEAPLGRIDEIFREVNTVPETNSPSMLPEVIKGNLAFKEVSFSYHSEATVLKEVSCEVKSGDIVALVGKSGAGKSTFINMIPRFYDPDQGVIEIDGVDIRKYSKEDLRSLIAYVPQMPILFNASIRENIGMGDLSATQEEIEEAAKQAFAHDFILKTESGYDTILSERGNSLSGGQRQRVAIARAFLKSAPFLILDEATSALDTESEEKVTDALNKLMKGRTTFMIAHRESSLKAANRRLTFEDGVLIASL